MDVWRAEKMAACLAERMVLHLGCLKAEWKAGSLGLRRGFC